MKTDGFRAEIIEKKMITKGLFLLTFDNRIHAKPGQFVMIRKGCTGDKPFSIADNNPLRIIAKPVGEFTGLLCNADEGDGFFFRGPYGNCFSTPKGKNISLIGGGCGIGPLLFLHKTLRDINNINTYLGLKTLTIPENKIKNIFSIEKIRIFTEDNSSKNHGLITDNLREILRDIEYVFTCGPEIMMKKIYDYCLYNHIPLELSIERYMKCGIGLCGTCYCGSVCVCRDGPVFDISQLKNISDFGYAYRDVSGRKIRLR